MLLWQDGASGGKAKKKKWSKGKVRDKLNNLVLFDKVRQLGLLSMTMTRGLVDSPVLRAVHIEMLNMVVFWFSLVPFFLVLQATYDKLYKEGKIG